MYCQFLNAEEKEININFTKLLALQECNGEAIFLKHRGKFLRTKEQIRTYKKKFGGKLGLKNVQNNEINNNKAHANHNF